MKPKDAEAAEETSKLIKYLQRHHGRLDYRFAHKGGQFRGSGGIESVHKFICHVRFRRSGAWWCVGNANQMPALRCTTYNGAFDGVFEAYRQEIEQSPVESSRKQ